MNTRSDNDAAGVWSDVSTRLKDTLSESTWSTWFAGVSPVGMDAESIEVSVPNEFARQWIEGHFSALVAGCGTRCDRCTARRPLPGRRAGCGT